MPKVPSKAIKVSVHPSPQAEHDYCSRSLRVDASVRIRPPVKPERKRVKGEISLFQSLAAFINEPSDNLKNTISRISNRMDALKASIHFVFKEIDTLKLQTEAVKLNVRVPTKGCPTPRPEYVCVCVCVHSPVL